jgi:pyruvate,water dikinase
MERLEQSSRVSVDADLTTLLPLDRITPADAARVGGKAYGCACLKQAGFPVPDGVLVLVDGTRSLGASAALEQWLRGLPDHTLLAVRSSATDEDSPGHSFAGIYETRLNVPPDKVGTAIDACRASAASARASAYRQARGLDAARVDMPILVQRMIEPRVSGVAFTADPISGAADELVINSCWGLGEALVSGHVDPDEFRLRKSDGAVLSARTGGKRYRAVAADGACRLVETPAAERLAPTLTADQLGALAALLVRVERHHDAPQDVEWCHDGAQFWLLQSRPLTTRPAASGPEIEWTRANTREVLPDVTSPQALAWLSEHIERAFRAIGGKLLAPEAVLGPMVKAFHGRLYFNLSQIRHLCRMIGIAPAVFLRATGHPDELTAEDERRSRPSVREWFSLLPDVPRLTYMRLTTGRSVRALIARLPGMARELDERNPNPLSDGEVLSTIDAVGETLYEHFRHNLAVGGVALYEAAVEYLCRQVGFSSALLLQTHLASGERSVTTQQAFDLLLLARQAQGEQRAHRYFTDVGDSFAGYADALAGTEFLGAFERFVARYGHRGIYESDWALPRYREDPTPLLATIRMHLQTSGRVPSPAEIAARQEGEAVEAWAAFAARLHGWRRVLRPLVRWLLDRTKQMYLWRERCRSEAVRVWSALRRLHLVLAQRWVERGWLAEPDHYFHLTLAEIRGAVADPRAATVLPQLVTRRQAELRAWRELDMPLLLRERDLPRVMHRAHGLRLDSDATRLHGLCVSAGCVEAEVAVLATPTDFARMKSGAILVAPATDPSWTPLFTLAAGVIVEIGGTLSHTSTVAREYGLPALANVRDATRILRTGDRVRLDATNGVVQLVTRGVDIATGV